MFATTGDEKPAGSALDSSTLENRSTTHDLQDKEIAKVDSEEQPPAAEAPIEYPKSFELVAVFIALILSIFLVSLDLTIVATAIPRITDDFHSLDQVAWYAAAFFLTLASFQSTWGKVYKYFPIKISFLVSIGIF